MKRIKAIKTLFSFLFLLNSVCSYSQFQSASIMRSLNTKDGLFIGAGDVDNDGDPDIITYDATLKQEVWLENQCKGRFSSVHPLPFNYTNGWDNVLIEDINKDGINDIILSNGRPLNNPGMTTLLYGKGNKNGNFEPTQFSVSFPKMVDFDHDGYLDIVGVDYYDSTVVWLRNNGLGFDSPTLILNIHMKPRWMMDICVADFNGDSYYDIAFLTENFFYNTIQKLQLYLNDGKNEYLPLIKVDSTRETIFKLYPIDIDNDGDIDIAGSSYQAHWYENQGNGQFTKRFITVAGQYLTFRDFNNDNLIDVFRTSVGQEELILNNGDKSFSKETYFTPGYGHAAATADFDMDGDMDVICQSSVEGYIKYYNNNTINDVIVRPVITASIDTVICKGTRFYNGKSFYNEAGTYIDTLLSIMSCDSILTTHLEVFPIWTTEIDTSIAIGEKYFAGGMYRTKEGRYYDRFLSKNGCDSLVITNLFNNPTAISEEAGVTLIIFPNPVERYLRVQLNGLERIDVLDLSGRKLMQTGNNEIDFSSYKKGTYLLHVKTRKGSTYKRKITILGE